MRSPDSSSRVAEAIEALADFSEKVRRGESAGLVTALVRPWWLAIVIALTLSAVHGFAITFQTLMPKWLIADVLGKEGAGASDMFLSGLRLVALYIVVSLIGRMLFWHIGYRFFTHVRERILFVLRTHFFRHVNHLCLHFHGKHNSGELLSYILGSPMAAIMAFYSNVTMSLPGQLFATLSVVATMAVWDPWLSLMLVLLGVVNGILFRLAYTRMRGLNKQYQDAEADVVGNVADLMRGTRAIKVYAMADKVTRDFDRDAFAIGQMGYDRDVKTHVEYMKVESSSYVVFSLVVIAAVWRYQAGINAGIIAAFLTAFVTVTSNMSSFLGVVSHWSAAQAAIMRITEVLKTPTSTPDLPGETVAVPKDGVIAFNDLCFRYGDDLEDVLQAFHLEVPYGQRVALVGPSGAGKSTIAQLMIRLYDPRRGSISIGGVDLREMACDDLRRHFGVVPQDPFIFQTTIRDNVRVARPDASDADVIRACERANAWEFVSSIPEQLDANVGEGGVKLSGGQRQRLAIARVVLADPSYFIFDEATSALDTVSEKLIQSAIEDNLAGRSAVFIAHRLSTVRNCDRVVVLDAGRIVQDGNYQDLMSRPGPFRDMVEGQALL